MNPAAWALFTAVDVDRSGSISEKELQVALSNGGWTTFSPRTTRVLIRMFDADRSGASCRATPCVQCFNPHRCTAALSL